MHMRRVSRLHLLLYVYLCVLVAIWKEVMVAVMTSMSVQSTMELAPTHVPTIKADTHADVKIEHSKLATG